MSRFCCWARWHHRHISVCSSARTAPSKPTTTQTYTWPDSGLFLSLVTSLAVVKAQWPMYVLGSTDTTPHCTENLCACVSRRGRWQAALMAALHVEANGVPWRYRPRRPVRIKIRISALPSTIAKVCQWIFIGARWSRMLLTGDDSYTAISREWIPIRKIFLFIGEEAG